jgi:phosphotriesterase-related protein
VEFDLWGMEVFPTVAALTRTPPEVRAASLAWFIAAGMTDRILLSHDTGHRQQLRHHGGYGLAHLLRDLSPQFHAYGITDETLDRITVQNPRRLMPYRPVGAAAGAV